ncbi:MAG: TRAP transporter large permease [Tissierellia bacterium]|jgi:C4-dicarboxylate transporter DctM subunit|nr:TRAP transporter large permease [Tissierellia bacterium]
MGAGLLFLLAGIFLLIGAPIVTSVGLASIIFGYSEGINLVVVIQKMFAGIDTTSLLAVPFFILAGDLMNSGGIAKRIVNMASKLVGNVHGGVGIVAIISCMFFAAISGSGIATAAAIGGVMYYGFLRDGYDKAFSAAIVSTASPLGIVIPPSIAFIVYATITGASVSSLYKVGFPAGIIVGIFLMIPTYFISKKRGYKAKGEKIRSGEIIIDELPEEYLRGEENQLTGAKALIDSLWALGTPFIIVGGVFAGVFTPTESAVVAVVYSIIIGIYIYKEMKWSDLPGIFYKSALSNAAIMIIIAGASLFAWVMTYVRLPQNIMEATIGGGYGKNMLLLLVNLIILFAGMFMESAAIQYIVVPIAFPLLTSVGVDPIHFGIMIATNLAIGQMSPPFGTVLFTTTRTYNVPIQDLIREVIPFWIAMILALIVIIYMPFLVMWPLGL